MESLARGWSFLIQAWQMAFKDKDLIKPSLYALLIGITVTIAGLIPLLGVWVLLGDSTLLGRAVLALVGAAVLFVHYVVSYVFSGMTVYLIYGYLAEGDGRMDKAWARVRAEFRNIVSLAAASTAVNLVAKRLQRGRRGQSASILGGMLGGLLDVVWTEASFLILPAMMIENANLSMGVKRATQIAKGNLLLVGLSTVGVRWVTGLIGFVLGAMELIAGFGLGYGLSAVVGATTAGIITSIGLGALVFFAFAVVASVIGSYTMTAYHTCLFLWARDVEKARAEGQPLEVPAPAPLAVALS